MANENKYGQINIQGIPENEPIFVFRAQDALATIAIRFYQELRRSAGDREGAADIELAIKRFNTWGTKKLPD